MKSNLSIDQAIDLVYFLGATQVNSPKGNKFQYTCTIHREVRPSAGIIVEFNPEDTDLSIDCFNCLSCHAKGTIPGLVFKSIDDFNRIYEVLAFLKKRYAVDYKYHYNPETKQITRYEDLFQCTVKPRHEISNLSLAVLKSGKETYKYFFDRGFGKDDMKEYMVGRNLDDETVTIPVFWEDGKVAGIVGRFIDPNRPKNMRYRIYDFAKSDLLWPIDKVEKTNTVILTEGIFDAMRLRKWGIKNVLTPMTNSISKKQAKYLSQNFNRVITLFDSDSGGDFGRDRVDEMLKHSLTVLHPSYYPEEGKDPEEWGKKETLNVLDSVSILRRNKILRLE